MEFEFYKADLPYPSVNGKINERTFSLLMESYGGRASETTAILQYAYQHYLMDNYNEELSKILEGFSIVEMSHHQMLANAILTFGGNPVIGGNSGYFSGNYVNYVKDARSIIYVDIEGEKQAIEDYQRIVEFSDNQSLSSLISRIIIDEELHIKILQNLYQKL